MTQARTQRIPSILLPADTFTKKKREHQVERPKNASLNSIPSQIYF